MCNQQSLRSACPYAQSDQNLCKSLEYCINVKLLTEHHSEFLSLKVGCTGKSESTLVKIPYCWNCKKSHAAAPFIIIIIIIIISVSKRKYDPLNEHTKLEPRRGKTGLRGLRTTQTQTSLRIRAVWSAPLLFAF